MRTVVHEILNHLAVVVANVEAFRDGALEPSPARLTAVLQALHEVEVLLHDIPRGIATAHLNEATQAINVCDWIANEVLGLEALAKERGVGFSVRQCIAHKPECSRFVCNPVRIGEIVNNVVSNAIRYTPIGGRVEVDCRPVGDAIMLNVTDDGPGISSEDLVHIFESGFRGTASRDTQGSGMGLSLTKRFVEEHGGSIDVQNIEGRGAQFTVRLPVIAKPLALRDGHHADLAIPEEICGHARPAHAGATYAASLTSVGLQTQPAF